MKLFSVTFVNSGFILNATTLIIYITGIFKTAMNPGIAQNVAAQFFLSIPYLATKNSWLVVLTLTVTSYCGKTFYYKFWTLKPVSAIFYQIFIFHQITALQKVRKMFFISSNKLFSFSRYSNFCIFFFPFLFPCQPLH